MTKAMKLFGILAVAALAAAGPALAICNPGKGFGQFIGDPAVSTMTTWPDASGDPAVMIGRFWQPGIARTIVSEGTYGIELWNFAGDLVGYPAGTTTSYGFLGDEGVLGCPALAMITVMQSPNTDGDGASFVVVRVPEEPGNATGLDFQWLGLGELMGRPIPKPAISSVKVPGTRQINLTVAGPDVTPLFYGPSPLVATDAIAARRLYQFFGPGLPGSVRSPETGSWVYTNQRLTGAATGTAALTIDCDTVPAGQDVFYAWALEFEGGLVSDFVGKSTQVVCNSGLAAPGKFKNIDKRQGPKNK